MRVPIEMLHHNSRQSIISVNGGVNELAFALPTVTGRNRRGPKLHPVSLAKLIKLDIV